MKSILLSIKPEWLVKILNGEKTIEVRKKFPKDYVGWVYIYVTKALPHLSKTYVGDYEVYDDTQWDKEWLDLNGKVVARFWCDEVLPIIKVVEQWGLYYYTCQTKQFYYNPDKLTSQSCLSTNQIRDYLGDKNGFAIHFSTLEIFDRPKELSEFHKVGFYELADCIYEEYRDEGYDKDGASSKSWWDAHCEKHLTKAPQNYCYIEGV